MMNGLGCKYLLRFAHVLSDETCAGRPEGAVLLSGMAAAGILAGGELQDLYEAALRLVAGFFA